MKTETKISFLLLFSFCSSFSFLFVFDSTWPRGAIDGQLSLDSLKSALAIFLKSTWPRCAINGLLPLLIYLEVP